jgi:hypothetical protein
LKRKARSKDRAFYLAAGASRQTQQWPQQQRDAHHQRTEAARHYEKKKVFHAVVRRHPFPDKATLEPGIRSGHSHLRSRPAVKADFRLLRWSLALLARFESAMTIALSSETGTPASHGAIYAKSSQISNLL